MAVDYYVDGDKQRIDPDLLCGRAEGAARRMFPRDDRRRGRGQDPAYGQLRNFYNEVLMRRSRIDATGVDRDLRSAAFERELPFIRMLAAKAAYKHERGLINPAIRDFIVNQAKSIEDLTDFDVFCCYFEAVIAFARG